MRIEVLMRELGESMSVARTAEVVGVSNSGDEFRSPGPDHSRQAGTRQVYLRQQLISSPSVLLTCAHAMPCRSETRSRHSASPGPNRSLSSLPQPAIVASVTLQ